TTTSAPAWMGPARKAESTTVSRRSTSAPVPRGRQSRLRFPPHPLREAIDANDLKLVGAAGNGFLFVVGFELKGNHVAFGVNNARPAGDRPADGRGSEVPHLNMSSDGAFAGFKQGQHRG